MIYGAPGLVRLLRSQWWSRDRLERWRLHRLRRLVRHAYETVPLHRRRMEEAGVRPEEILTLQDLERLPLLSRAELQDAPLHDVVSRGTDLGRCLRFRTSGSTGIPLEIVSSPEDSWVSHASFFRVYLGWGIRPWNRLTYMTARPHPRTGRSWYERLGVFRRQELLSADDPEAWLTGLRRWRPHLVNGYVLTLKLLADAVTGSPEDPPRIPVVVSTSGVLDDSARASLAEAFGCRVVDVYASHEAGSVIAWECPTCDGYHLSEDTVLVEFLRDGRPAAPDEDADIVITSLTNFTMPFLRYRQGDVGQRSSVLPTCGRQLALMHRIQGRASDFVVLPSGRRLTPHHFFVALDHTTGVGRWQIEQLSVRRLLVRICPRQPPHPGIAETARAELHRLMGSDVQIDVELVPELRPDRTRKLRSIVSRVPGATV